MRRIDTRVLVRLVAESGDSAAALALYEYSMRLGHGKIALLRYMDAKDLAAPLSESHDTYARAVAATLSGSEVEKIARHALEKSRLRRRRSR